MQHHMCQIQRNDVQAKPCRSRTIEARLRKRKLEARGSAASLVLPIFHVRKEPLRNQEPTRTQTFIERPRRTHALLRRALSRHEPSNCQRHIAQNSLLRGLNCMSNCGPGQDLARKRKSNHKDEDRQRPYPPRRHETGTVCTDTSHAQSGGLG